MKTQAVLDAVEPVSRANGNGRRPRRRRARESPLYTSAFPNTK